VIRPRYVIPVVLALALFLLWLVWPARHAANAPQSGSNTAASAAAAPAPDALAPTVIYAHNLLLRKGPQFRVYISWIRGQMLRTRTNVDPSFDNPESFVLLIQKGVIHANLGDIGAFLNATSFPLKNITVRGEGDQVKLTGTMHKLLVPLPVELLSTVSATPDGRIHLHINKINVLKIPVKGLMGGLHVEIDDVVGATPMSGVEVSGNDLFLNTTQLLPPPHIRGQLTSVTVQSPDLVLIYGNSKDDESKLAQWHNFLRFTGGTLGFGKLSMHPVDLTLIDASDDPWFDLDLVNYQAQLVNGYSRMTPQSGLEIFMPELDQLQQKKASPSITLDWLKNRSQPLPPDVSKKTSPVK
jgi:hypothetical protein